VLNLLEKTMKTDDIILVKPANKKEMDVIVAFLNALKIEFKATEESLYNQEFVDKIYKSRQQVEEGKTVKISLDDILQTS
jgi:uncharacterized radical SAM superfamily Fe-S cluster-containing enzyme